MIPLHPKDQEYFDSYPAPIMKMLQERHFCNINSTITFFGPMLYFMVRAFLCKRVLEIGTAEGATSYYIANAVKDNAIRNNYKSAMFYGIDICQVEKTKKNLDNANLPNIMISLDTINLTKETFKDIQFDLIFQDGAHDETHVFHEFKTLWSQLQGNGLGYWIMHDTMGPANEGYKKVMEYINDNKIPIENVTLDDGIYGLTVLRKMTGYIDRIYPY